MKIILINAPKLATIFITAKYKMLNFRALGLLFLLFIY